MKQTKSGTFILSEKDKDSWVLSEADRCLSCYDPPCQKACPASIPIPSFISAIKSGNLKYAAALVREANPMVATCGEVCPEEVFCQTHCTRTQIDKPIKIRELHGYATRFESDSAASKMHQTGSAAIIGSGPAGISCAVKLAQAGFSVTIYEQSDHPGGVPNSSIPKFRIENETIEIDINHARKQGVKILLRSSVDNPQSLLKQFDAVFMATGLPENRYLNIPGENLPQILSALAFLEKARSGLVEILSGKRVIVVGGGNVSLDVAASAAALDAAEVRLLYRRSPKEIKVWNSELKEAQNRGVMIDYLTNPIEFIGEGQTLKGVKCIRMRLSDELDSGGRKVPRAVPGSEFIISADLVITAVGLESNYQKNARIETGFSTSIGGVFAGGDWARGEGTIVEAVRDGKLAAQSIIDYVKAKRK
jgi:NADPH-dependent glutamate synthase beta subunit-like oxidoreductase